jgi:hypothetical protein
MLAVKGTGVVPAKDPPMLKLVEKLDGLIDNFGVEYSHT